MSFFDLQLLVIPLVYSTFFKNKTSLIDAVNLHDYIFAGVLQQFCTKIHFWDQEMELHLN
jgi:hypothetical protein